MIIDDYHNNVVKMHSSERVRKQIKYSTILIFTNKIK